MWKQILDLLKKVIALTRATETNASDIAGLREELHDLRKDFRDFNNRMDTLSQIVQHLLHEMSKDRELAAKDRENLSSMVRRVTGFEWSGERLILE